MTQAARANDQSIPASERAHRMRGIVTVLNTPFHLDDTLDLDGLHANVARALDAGVAGFLVNAKAAEVDRLSLGERERIAALVIEQVQGAVPVVVGVSAPSAPQRLHLARQALRAGADAILADLGYHGDDAAYRAQALGLAELDPPLLMLQDWSSAGPGLPVDLVARLFAEVPCFRALKIEVPLAGPKYTAVMEACGERLHVSGGWAVQQMIDGLDRGVHAFMPTALHYVYCEIYDLYTAGRREAARELFERLLPVLAFSNQHLDVSIHFFKRLCFVERLFASPRVREPIAPFCPVFERHTLELIPRALALDEECARERLARRAHQRQETAL